MMKQVLILIFFMLFSTALLQAAVLNISIDNINKKYLDAPIAIAIFKSKKGFPRKKKFAFIKKFTKASELPLKINLKKGRYAVAIFHDQNKNQKLDTNFIGIPKEPFGFSNNPNLLTGPPSFKKATVLIPKDNSNINIKMKLRGFL